METANRKSHHPHAPSAPRQVAIVGLNRETAGLLPSLLEAADVQVIKVLNPDLEDLSRLTQYPHLGMIIDTTGSPAIAARLRKLPLRRVDVISGLGARILFCALRGDPGSAGSRCHVVDCMEEVRGVLGMTPSRDEILRVVLNTAVKLTGAGSGSLMLLDATRRQLTIEAAVGLDEQVVLSAVQRVGKGISGTAIRTGKPILLQGPADKGAYGADYDRPDIASSICCPLLCGDEALGVLNVASRDSARVFGPADLAFIEDLARLTAEMIRSAKDHDAVPHAAHVQAAGLCHSAREILAMPFRFEERLNLLLMKLANAFSADLCCYYEYSAEEGVFVARASSAAAGTRLPREKHRLLDDFFAQRVLKTDNTFCVNAAGKGPRDKKWYLLQPIRMGQELIGTLFVHLHSEKNGLKEETALLRKVGEMLGREAARNKEMEAIKAQSLKYSAISQFSYDLGGAGTLEELARMILANLGSILEAETCVLRLRNEPDGELKVYDTLSRKNPAWLKDILEMDGRLTADLGAGRPVALFPDLRESPYNGGLLGSESALAAAFEINGRLLGTLSLYDRKSEDLSGDRSFGEADREMMATFALQAAKGLKRFHPFAFPEGWIPASESGQAVSSGASAPEAQEG